jgi:hypothetical protein
LKTVSCRVAPYKKKRREYMTPLTFYSNFDH